MIPEIRQRTHAQRADIGIPVIAHERSDLFAIHGFADVAIDQRRAIGGIPDVVLGIGKGSHAGLFVGDGQTGSGHFFSLRLTRGSNLLADTRGGVIRIVMIEIGFDVLRVVDVAMVAFAIVFPDQFPICIYEVIDGASNFSVFKTLGPRQFSKYFISQIKIRRVRAERNEEQTFGFPQFNPAQPESGFIERVLHACRMEQCAVQLVGPAMIGTHQLFGVAAGIFTEEGTTMATDVMQRMGLALVIANEDNGIRIQLQSKPVAGFRDFAGMPGKKPTFAPNQVDIGLVNFRIRIKTAQQAMAARLLGEQAT